MKIVSKTLSKNHNVSDESDAKIFLRYVGFFLFLLGMLYLIFVILGMLVIRFVSIEDEKRFFGLGDVSPLGEVRSLPDELSTRYSDIPYTIKLLESDIENAYTHLGETLYLTTAFLEETQHLEALDFIVGHEIGHIENRDVLRGLISDIPLLLIIGALGIDGGKEIFDGIIANTFNRHQESKADIAGIEYVMKKNGHIGCSLEFFEHHNDVVGNISEILSSHPMTEFRILKLQRYISKKGYPSKKCTPYTY